jgi:hypothetical protein
MICFLWSPCGYTELDACGPMYVMGPFPNMYQRSWTTGSSF